MDTRFLESLIAVVETGSIAGAARRQNLTPAAISQRIQALESDIGCALLIRSAHKAKPTQSCLNLLPRARKIVQETGALIGDVDPSGLTGVLRIGAISTILTGLLPAVLNRFIEVAPRVKPYIIPGTSKELFEELCAENLDAAILVEAPFPIPRNLISESLRKEPLLLLSGNQDERSISEILSTEPYICYDPKSWGGQIAERYLTDNQIKPETLCELDALETIHLLVKEGLGISLVPNWIGLQQNTLSLRIIKDDRYLRKIVLLYPKQPQHPKIIEKLKLSLFL